MYKNCLLPQLRKMIIRSPAVLRTQKQILEKNTEILAFIFSSAILVKSELFKRGFLPIKVSHIYFEMNNVHFFLTFSYIEKNIFLISQVRHHYCCKNKKKNPQTKKAFTFSKSDIKPRKSRPW